MGEGLISIQRNAFEGCSSLQEITIPEHLQTIGINAFYGCSELNKITSLNPFPIAVSYDLFSSINIENCTLVVPEWSAMLYKMAMGWSEFAKIETVKTGDLESLTITDTRVLPASVRPSGTPNVTINSTGSFTIRGEAAFPMNDVFLNISIGEGERKYDENGNRYYTPSLQGSVLFNDGSNLSIKSARIGIESVEAKWGFISLPFDVNISEISHQDPSKSSNYIWKTYDGERRALVGTGGNWVEVTDTLKAGVGYIYQSQDSAAILLKATSETFSNIMNQTDIKVTLASNTSFEAEDAGWNFIGNPYPTYFDTHYIDFTAPITVWNGKGYDAISLTDDNYILKPYEAFFVQKQSDSNTLTFFSAGRKAEDTTIPGSSRVKAYTMNNSDNRVVFNIYLSSIDYTDKTRIVLNENACINYDASSDAAKFFSDNDVPQLYSLDTEGVQYAINERPFSDGCVKLGLIVNRAGSYSIHTDSMEDIILVDNKMNAEVNLSEGDYVFDSDECNTENRFEVRFTHSVSEIEDINYTNYIKVETAANLLIVSHSTNNAVEIYTTSGILLEKANGHQCKFVLSSGLYIIKVGDSIHKVIVR